LATLAFIVFELEMIGVVVLATAVVPAQFGLDVSRIAFAEFGVVLTAALTYYDISIRTRQLGICAVTALGLMALGAGAVSVHGGGLQSSATWLASAGRVRAWQRFVGSRLRLPNTCGPTETTIVATTCDLWEQEPGRDPSAEAGKLLRGATRLYALAGLQSTVGTVLIFDNDSTTVEVVRRALEGEGYTALVIDRATARTLPRVSDLMLVDCVLLGGESPSTYERSWELAASLHQSRAPVPTIMVTADAQAAEEARTGRSPRAQAAGFVAVITKPFLLDELLAAVARAVKLTPT
jgi:CheY-like chemotaxis protein